MTPETVDTEHGTVLVKPRTSTFVPDLEGAEVWWGDQFVGLVLPRRRGGWRAMATGTALRDHPEPYARRIDAITFLAGVGRDRHGRSNAGT